MDTAIADFLLSNALPPSLSECPKLKLLIQAAKHAPIGYNPPTRKIVAGSLLDANYQTVVNKMSSQLQTDSTKYGLMIYGDGATIIKRPLINILCSGINNHAALLDVADCSGHVAEGNKKDAAYIAKLFLPHMEKLDAEKTRFELLCMFECVRIIVRYLTLHIYFCHTTMSYYLGLIYVHSTGQVMYKRQEKFCRNIILG